MRIILLTAFLALQIVASAHPDNVAAIPIPAESESPYDFRGKPAWDDPEYRALHRAKTYGELHEALHNFMEKWSARLKELKEPAHIAAYFTAKQAVIRTSYLMGMVAEGDMLMAELHPKQLGLIPDGKQAEKPDPVERERINRLAVQISVLYEELGAGKAYPDGPPADTHDLYAPLLKLIKDMGN